MRIVRPTGLVHICDLFGKKGALLLSTCHHSLRELYRYEQTEGKREGKEVKVIKEKDILKIKKGCKEKWKEGRKENDKDGHEELEALNAVNILIVVFWDMMPVVLLPTFQR